MAAALGSLAACASPGAPGGAALPVVPATHIVLITIDTLRADRVGAYGYTKARTPHIDALAAAGLTATRAYATAPVTLPSHASMLSGRYPPVHGARHNGVAMGEGVPTLATIYKAAGFATVGPRRCSTCRRSWRICPTRSRSGGTSPGSRLRACSTAAWK